MTRFSLLANTCLILLSSCAAVPQTVSVPVHVGCLPAEGIPTLPALTEGASLAALSDYELVLRIAAERLDLISWSRQAQVIIEACK